MRQFLRVVLHLMRIDYRPHPEVAHGITRIGRYRRRLDSGNPSKLRPIANQCGFVPAALRLRRSL